MLPSTDLSVNKLPKADTDGFLVLKSTWNQDTIHLKIVDLELKTEFEGTLPIDDLKESAEDLEIEFEDFFGNIKQALCTNGGQNDYEYGLEDNTFILRKIQPFKEIHCQVLLTPQPGLLQELLFDSIDTIITLKNELSTKQLDYQTLDMEFKMLAQSYEKSVIEKNATETELLKKCAVLLNAKKNKIAELQQLLSEGRRFAEENNSSATSENQNSTAGDDELTQPMRFTQTQKVARALPKRKNLVAAEAVSKRIRSPEPFACDEEQLQEGVDNDNETALNSEEMFDAMS